jgi:hypothetical protein
MRYVMLIFNSPEDMDRWNLLTPDEQEADTEAHRVWFRKYGSIIVGGEELALPETGRIITRRSGQLSSTDGPYAEAREFLGGFVIFDAPDMATAEAAASEWRGVERWNARIDLRPLASERT